jgi:hypothetical protein
VIPRPAVPWIIAGVMTIIALIAVVGGITVAARTAQQPPAAAAPPTGSPAATAAATAAATEGATADATAGAGEGNEDSGPSGELASGASTSPAAATNGKVDRKAAMSQSTRDARPGNGPLPSDQPVSCPAAATKVTTAAELSRALADAKPGNVIQLADGTYTGRFSTTNSGTPAQKIYMCGGRGAVLDAGSPEKGYAFHLDGASYWVLSGFTVRNGQKGIVADASTGSVLQNLAVADIGDEAIHLRKNSSSNLITGNTVRGTGSRNEKFGEGIYIGTAVSNWCTYTACLPDESNYNIIANNDIAGTTSESIDIKEGTIGGIVRGNRFDGAGMTAATAWMNVKGNAWTIDSNYGQNSPENGYETHNILQEWGDHNLFSNNSGAVNGPGYGIASWPAMHNTVACSNSLTGATRGLSNIRCSNN